MTIFQFFGTIKTSTMSTTCKCNLTRWLPAYGIFVLRFRPKKQQFSVALPTP